MTASKSFLLALLIAALATPALAKPAATPGVKQQFQELYNKMDNAMKHLDLNGFMSVYDSQFIEHTAGQPTQYIADYRQHCQQLFTTFKFPNPATTVSSCKPWGQGYLVFTHLHETYEAPDVYNTTILEHIVYDESDEDYWIKRNGVWKMREEIELSDKTLENGHEIG